MTWWEWTILGLILLVLEVMTPGGFFVMFFGAAGLLVGLLVALEVLRPLWLQWFMFSTMAVVSLLLFRGPLLRRVKASAAPPVDQLVGEAARVLDDVPAGGLGKAELRGTAWTVRNAGERGLGKGQRVRVERVDGLTLWVRAE
jgi:hypothetical protein